MDRLKVAKELLRAAKMVVAYNWDAKHSTDPYRLRELSKSDDWQTRMFVAGNSHCPSDVLSELSKDTHDRVRYNVAINKNTPISILEKLSRDPDLQVREAIAKRKDTPERILRELARDSKSWIRQSIADNPNCPSDILESLAEDEDVFVRANVASNPKTPVDILKRFLNDVYSVKEALKRNPNAPSRYFDGVSEDVLISGFVKRFCNGKMPKWTSRECKRSQCFDKTEHTLADDEYSRRNLVLFLKKHGDENLEVKVTKEKWIDSPSAMRGEREYTVCEGDRVDVTDTESGRGITIGVPDGSGW